MAAYEGKTIKQRFSLKQASQYAHYVIFFLYIFYTLGVILAVPWNQPGLGALFGVSEETLRSSSTKTASVSPLLLVMRSENFSNTTIYFFSVCIIFCVLSAANTSLYIASRTLWGLARDTDDSTPLRKQFNRISGIWEETSVPVVALLISTIALAGWFPLTQFAYFSEEVSLSSLSMISI